jgi:hypothetical protein
VQDIVDAYEAADRRREAADGRESGRQ